MASACVPDMDMRGMDVAAMGMRSLDMQLVHGGASEAPEAGSMGAASSHESHDREEERHCPFGPATAAQGCAGVASLPAQVMSQLAPSTEVMVRVFTETTEHDLLVGDALFRPPRA